MENYSLLDARSISLQAAPGIRKKKPQSGSRTDDTAGNISDKAAYRRQVEGNVKKEKYNGIGEGIAIPHEMCSGICSGTWQRW